MFPLALALLAAVQQPTKLVAPDDALPRGAGRLSRESERCVLEGLRWLARHQQEDGSWSSARLAARCDAEAPCGAASQDYVAHYDPGLTGLALLCFLEAGYGSDSKQGLFDPLRGTKHVLGGIVARGLAWLTTRQQADGNLFLQRFHVYTQSIGTLALVRAFALGHDESLREPAQRAVDCLQRAQRPSPSGAGLWGWRYASREEFEERHARGTLDAQGKRELYDADTSATQWAVRALAAASAAGLKVDPQALAGALDFTRWATAGDGLVGYTDPKQAGLAVAGPGDERFDYHVTTMTALGLCTRAFAGGLEGDPFCAPAAQRLLRDLPQVDKERRKVDTYYWYHGTLALAQLPAAARAKHQKPWEKALDAALHSTQDKTERSCHRGGWLAADRWSLAGGPVSSTALALLALEVPLAASR